MKMKWILASAIILFLLINTYLMITREAPRNTIISNNNIFTVSSQSLSETTLISGVFEYEEEELIYVDKTLGEIQNILVSEGQSVKIGTPLFEYNSESIAKQKKQIELERRRLHLQTEMSRRQISEMEAQFKEEVIEKGPDEAKSYNTGQLQDLQLQVELSEVELKTLEMDLEELDAKESSLLVKSSIDGTVRAVNAHPRSSDAPPVVHITSDSYVIRGTINEFDSVRVRPGQSVWIKSKALPDHKWNGKLQHIGSIPNKPESGESGTISKYPFIVTLEEPNSSLLPGYHVYIGIEETGLQQPLSIPSSAIVRKEDKTHVYVLEGDSIRLREVTTGNVNGEHIEIVDGILEGDRILLEPSNHWDEEEEVEIHD
ncbi:efflux RND transporter periplasmic adaptor subunit [Paenibacillus humicus]|uniref:efflux RND transporter periplasmic adaptor subunit n=1 Tax=Paenibacillus humicus TaxID=412861 RepID=UPI003D285678